MCKNGRGQHLGFFILETTFDRVSPYRFAEAFLVRMTLVPAFMAIMRDKMWWFSRWLNRIVPNFDVEGEQLTKRLDTEDTYKRYKAADGTSSRRMKA